MRPVQSLNPALLEGARLLRGDEALFAFECRVKAGGALVPLRRVSEALARSCLPLLASATPRALQLAARVWLQDVLHARCTSDKSRLDPLEFHVPCSFAFVTALTCFRAMRRSPSARHILSYILIGPEEVDAIFGMVGWHAPTAMEPNGFYLITVPEPPGAVQVGPTLDPRRVAGLKRHEYNFLSYDTASQQLTVRLSVARFLGSTRVRGAAVGKPPAEPAAAGGRWKFSLLERCWVARSTPAPTPRQLKERYPTGAPWLWW